MKRIQLHLAAAALALILPGCTSIFGGFEDPVAEVSLAGKLKRTNVRGQTFYFGSARNTGDTPVQNVKVFIDSFDAG